MESLAKRFEPSAIEEKWYSFWGRSGFFRADENSAKPPFSIVIPPPNITGILHMGHGLNNTLQDVLTRWKRMSGCNALWLPGTDHAGIATQNVVERMLLQEGLRKEDIGREKFVERVWKWREEFGSTIIRQLKRLGCSCDWSRERFTMDEGLSRAVRTVFKRLYDEGLVYKGTYMINWCPRCQTALSDDEVEYEDTVGKLWYIKYPLEEGSGFVSVATTRPETMLGDTAVAANPKDERYQNLIGRRAVLPILKRPLPIIADDYVKTDFGTGLVKITPAHDPNDYIIGKRHGLEEINVLEPDARINENGGPYKGMDRYECRKRILGDLAAQGLIEKIEDYSYAVGHCYRCETVVEPYISLQWFVKMRPLAEPAIRVVKEGKTRFVPQSWENTYFHWLENVRDWCISRQLWWGHRIPAWYCLDCDGIEVSAEEPPTRCTRCNSERLKQDEDVLDTWFSSALWPFSTLGWPEQTKDLEVFYPTSVLVTAHEIIFFWVARMIMMGLKFMGGVPFRDVYINPLVVDEHGEKMSKTKGNIIDPIQVIEESGADSLRFTLCAYTSQGRNVSLSLKRLEGYRNFMNKLWNAARFVLMNTEDLSREELAGGFRDDALRLEDRWILSAFQRLIKEVNRAINEYEFDAVASALYQFIWHQYCDWYVEMVKLRLYAKGQDGYGAREKTDRTNAQIILLIVLEGMLRLLHPIAPFITEEIWQRIRERYGHGTTQQTGLTECHQFLRALQFDSIMVASWLDSTDERWVSEQVENEMSLLQKTIYAIRNIRGEMNILPGTAIDVVIASSQGEHLALLREERRHFEALTKLRSLEFKESARQERFASTAIVEDVTVLVYLPVEMREQEIARLKKELERFQKDEERTAQKVQDERFRSRAPREVVEQEVSRLQQLREQKQQMQQKLDSLQ